MKLTLIAMAAVAAVFSIPSYAADVGVSVSIGQPRFYGQLDIGDFPPPQLIYAQPMVLDRDSMNRPPIYLHVPPSHSKHWGRHCREYDACGERVYFVQDGWYDREYVPRYQERHGNRHNEGRGKGNKDRHGKGKGKGNDNGEGRGNGHNRD